jgi:hypothetical protein
MRRLAVQRRIHVSTTRQQQARGALDDVGGVVTRVIELPGLSPRSFDRFEIVGHGAAWSDCD